MRSNQRQNKSKRESSKGKELSASPLPAFDEALLQARLDAHIAKLVDDANRGQPIWWQTAAWRWGLPVWAISGRVFRGLSALLLWQASVNHKNSLGWIEANSLEDPNAVVVPVRKKRGWAPFAMTSAARMAALSPIIKQWSSEPLDAVWNQLELEKCSRLSPYLRHIRELAAAFYQSLYRSPKQPMRFAETWTVEALRIAAQLGAFIADAAYALALGNVFDENAVWSRGDVAALFPWEAQEPGGLRQILDRGLARTSDARILAKGRRAGQLPVRAYVQLDLGKVWTQGRVIPGYVAILQLLDGLNQTISGDAVLDARALGRILALRIARLESLPDFVTSDVIDAWERLRKHIKYKSWAHRLHLLTFNDIRFYNRLWHEEQLLPRVRAAAKQIQGMTAASLGRISLKRIGLVRLLDAMGAERPLRPTSIEEVKSVIGVMPERTYRRYPIYKTDGSRRWLDVPNETLANAQKNIMNLLRPANPFAGVATAFEPGRAPAMHARMHEGAIAAVVIDIADFFGSVRPRHLRWAFHPRILPLEKPSRKANSVGDEARTLRAASRLLLEGGKKREREAILSLLFAGDSRHQWLPQGAPSSPWVANLAAHPMDRRIRQWLREHENVKYSRYADDLVLSLHTSDSGEQPDEFAITRFLDEAETVLRESVQARGWEVQEKKTRRWSKTGDRKPLILCGIEVPHASGLPCKLPREQHRRAKAALHRLRCGRASDHGFLAWAWGATGHPGWLAWTNPKLNDLSVAISGSLLAEAFLAGWADTIDEDETSYDNENIDR